MNLKKVTKKLSEVRDNIRKNGKMSSEDKASLKSLVGDTITIAQSDLKKLPNKIKYRQMPLAENDNTPLTTEQKFRLRLMEKAGSGSVSIH